MVIVALHQPNAHVFVLQMTWTYKQRRGHRRLTPPFHVRSLDDAGPVYIHADVAAGVIILLMMCLCLCVRCEEETYLLPAVIHLVIMQQPAGHHHRQTHWTSDSVTWTVNIISASSRPCDGFSLVLWTAGWAFSTFACVSGCRNMWGYSQLGWMNYSVLRRRKMLLYSSARRRACPGTLTQISGCSHTAESLWEVRETSEVTSQRSAMKMCAVHFPHSAPRQDFMLDVGAGAYHWLISESLHCNRDSICSSEFNAAWISAALIMSFDNLDAHYCLFIVGFDTE